MLNSYPMGRILNKKVKDIITRSLGDLADDVDPNVEFLTTLLRIPNCFSVDQVESIKKSDMGKYGRATEVLLFMLKRTDDEFIEFCKVLIDKRQSHVVKEYFSECLILLGTSYNILTRPSQADTSRGASAALGDAHSANPAQGYDGENREVDVTYENYKVEVTKSTKTFYESKREQAYPMDTKKSGFALIINVQRLEGQRERTGTDIDCKKIVSLMGQLDFDSITVYDDEDGLTYEELLDKVKAFAMTVHKEAQRVAMFILSFGDRGVVFGSDSKSVEVKELVAAVALDRLAGIPKMVVFQACRGDMIENDTDTSDSTQTSGLIICYATQDGCLAWRNRITGSWFIAALVDVFAKHCHQLEIRELMAKVKTEVGNRTSLTYDAETSGKCQTPETVSNLSKDWFLFPGYPDF